VAREVEGKKKMNNPKVSVIIPVYNGEKFLGEAIKSVLNQDYDNLECIVVDDGSVDGSAAIAKKFVQVVYLHQDNAGVAAARNQGVQKASGEYLAFLDADDIWDLEKLTIQISYLEENQDIGYSFTRHSLFLAEGVEELPAWVRKNQYEQEMSAYIPSALVVRKSVFAVVGNFDENYLVGEDSDWFMRAKDVGIKLGIVEQTLLYKRVHHQCLSSQTELSRKNLLKIVKASLQRAKIADKVSVIVPVYNGEKYLREALNSVLKQSVRPFEVLVIDDGSTDTTAEIAKQYGERLRYIKRSNGGAAAARNDGVKSATGNYIAFLDADDYWDKQKLALQLREIKKPGSANMIFALSAQFYSPETGEDFRQRYQCPSQLVKGVHPGTLMMKREDFLKVGLFSTEYKTGEFIEWYQRAQEAGMTSAFLPEILMYRRIHPLNHGIVQKQHNDDYARIVKEMLLRRRKKAADG
jgi:glycosyltransferase involved in cell wall biosynthesis